MTERLQELHRTIDRRDTFGVHGVTVEGGSGEEPDLQRRKIGTDLVHIRAKRSGSGIRIARRVAMARIKEGRTVAHRSAHHMTRSGTRPTLARARTVRDPRPRRLQTDKTALGSGNTDRTATVCRVSDWHNSGGHGGS